MARNIYEKIWAAHLVHEEPGQSPILYIDRHYVHEVTSPQAFEGLRLNNRRVRRPECTFGTMDHNVPTTDRSKPISDALAREQIAALAKNCADFEVTCFDMNHPDNGIVHVIGPELGLTLPGMTIVCGDSHTATHGAFGALAFGIGTSEVEHVLATQTLLQNKSKTMEIRVNGRLGEGVTAKDVILYIIGQIGTDGGTGYVIEYTGDVIRSFNMDERMTVCNMTIEAGARAGLVSPDKTTVDYCLSRPRLSKECAPADIEKQWLAWASDAGCSYDCVVEFEGSDIPPMVTWGTSPGMVASITDRTPVLSEIPELDKRHSTEKALTYMGLCENTPIDHIEIDKVFIGSCTNGRINDLRAAAAVVKGYTLHPHVKQALVVPGSNAVKMEAEKEGLDRVFTAAGFEWREPGCSMCLAMNEDRLEPGERCAATSNRNFEGRMGKGGRTHLVSPAMAAAAGISGRFVDIRTWNYK